MSKNETYKITLEIWENVFDQIREDRRVYVKTTAIADQDGNPAWVKGRVVYVNRKKH